jgi:hypothetical protein
VFRVVRLAELFGIVSAWAGFSTITSEPRRRAKRPAQFSDITGVRRF